ncbi:hypothetical protein A2311_06555 [candidate division WOR-1 bacterium RIFOXYB2_FULL_48_7]|uniref:Mce/MlaD domain-containing protein n=1 Tax=candidate division WOR-1 bacterium RIFOXYB2_FULL_48_7 TaxID=1802583 RepID=A0A1F4T9I5_UNCSA|nr:MAG: hypothetical protein A2311_06555 [candidate division WOR-1 bacterium RIFOXYB2_FULL_48_7]
MELSTKAKVGLFTMIGFVLIGMVIVWKSELLLLNRGYQVIATFENVEGLTVGSELRFRGLKVGKVLRIDPGVYDIKVFSVVDPSIKIPSDSTLRVAYDGIVGMKYLEVKPGTSEVLYRAGKELKGIRTAAIVDFVDIAAKNLQETKAILEIVRKIIDNPELQRAFINAVYVTENTAIEAEKLVKELNKATTGIAKITADPNFQANVKDTVGGTAKTLNSANKFFEGVANLNLRASGGVDIGTKANAVRGDVDVIANDKTYYRLGFGEGPSRQLSVLDFLFTNKMANDLGFRLGVINSQLGGGVFRNLANKNVVIADIYDINNPRPNNPKIRLSYEQEMQSYMDMLLQADDVLNSGSRNIMLGIRVKPTGDNLY